MAVDVFIKHLSFYLVSESILRDCTFCVPPRLANVILVLGSFIPPLVPDFLRAQAALKVILNSDFWMWKNLS